MLQLLSSMSQFTGSEYRLRNSILLLVAVPTYMSFCLSILRRCWFHFGLHCFPCKKQVNTYNPRVVSIFPIFMLWIKWPIFHKICYDSSDTTRIIIFVIFSHLQSVIPMADTLLHEVGTRQHLHFFYAQLFHKTNRFLPYVYLSSRQHFVTIIRTKWRLF